MLIRIRHLKRELTLTTQNRFGVFVGDGHTILAARDLSERRSKLKKSSGAPAKAGTNPVGAKSEGAAEGGCGGNSAAPEPEAKPRRLPETLRAETSKNIFFSLIEKNWGWRAKSKNAKKMFLLGTRALRAAAGRSDWFRSGILDKMSSSQIVKTHHVGKVKEFWFASRSLSRRRRDSATNLYSILGAKTNSRFRIWGKKVFPY